MGHLVIVIIACALLYAAAGADMKSQVRWKTAESESAADRKLLQDTLEACKASTVTHDSP